MSSKIISKQPIDFNTKIMVTELPSRELVMNHIKNIREIFPDKSNEETNSMVGNAIFRDLAFDAIMNYVSSLYQFEFDPNDIEQIKKNEAFQNMVEAGFEHRPNLGRDNIENEYAKQEIRKVLLFDDLLETLDIRYSDEEFDQLIEKYYADTNLSIREWKKNSVAREGAKRTLLTEKLINTMITKFVNLDGSVYFERLQKLNDMNPIQTKSKPESDSQK